MIRWLLAGTCALAVNVVLPGAWAQQPGDPEPPGEPPAEDAQAHYQRGRQLYQSGRYQEAVRELEQALSLDPDEPVLLFNLALVEEKLDHFDDAVSYLQRVLQTEQTPDERERIEATIRRLQGARVHTPPVPPRVIQVPVPVPVPQVPREVTFGRADTVFWVVSSAAGLALATSLVTGALALSAETEVDRFYVGDDGSLRDRQAHVDRANALALSSDLALGVAGAAALTATLLYALRSPEAERPARPTTRPTVGLAPVPGGAAATLGGRF